MKTSILRSLKNVTGNMRKTARELAIDAGISAFSEKDSFPSVRKTVRKLIAEGAPIGSDGSGFYMITEHDELEDVLEMLQSRCDALQQRIVGITNAYTDMRDARHLDDFYPVKDRCRFFVIYIAETSKIPYQAVWTMAYRKLQKQIKIDLVNLPAWYRGSVINYVSIQGYLKELYDVFLQLEKELI